MRTIATHHKVTAGVSEDCVNYLALALRARLQDLVTAMISAARHRTRAQFDRPASLYEDGAAAWGIIVRSDVAKQLAALERVEREEEMRERGVRQMREEAIDATLAAALAGEEHALEMPTEEGVAAARKRRTKAEEKRPAEIERRTTNATAIEAAGITRKYAWMKTGLPVNPRAAPAPEPDGPPRPYRAKKSVAARDLSVNVRDAMFVVEKERGHGGGRGAARGWT